eukprot:13900311-Ditylum_brightwellii.AAC.1
MPQKWREESAKQHISAPTVAPRGGAGRHRCASIRPGVQGKDKFAYQGVPQLPVPPPELGKAEKKFVVLWWIEEIVAYVLRRQIGGSFVLAGPSRAILQS